MPTYQYACTGCDERLEVVQKFSDEPLTVCPACDGKLRKVFSPVGIVFKGSGFYRTDSRSDSKASAANGSNGSKSETAEKPSGASADKAAAGSEKKSGDSSSSSTSSTSSASGSSTSGSAASSGSKVA